MLLDDPCILLSEVQAKSLPCLQRSKMFMAVSVRKSRPSMDRKRPKLCSSSFHRLPPDLVCVIVSHDPTILSAIRATSRTIRDNLACEKHWRIACLRKNRTGLSFHETWQQTVTIEKKKSRDDPFSHLETPLLTGPEDLEGSTSLAMLSKPSSETSSSSHGAPTGGLEGHRETRGNPNHIHSFIPP